MKEHRIYKNSNGKEHYLFKSKILLRGGRYRDIYYFVPSTNQKDAVKVDELPEGYKIKEAKSGALLAVRESD